MGPKADVLPTLALVYLKYITWISLAVNLDRMVEVAGARQTLILDYRRKLHCSLLEAKAKKPVKDFLSEQMTREMAKKEVRILQV